MTNWPKAHCQCQYTIEPPALGTISCPDCGRKRFIDRAWVLERAGDPLTIAEVGLLLRRDTKWVRYHTRILPHVKLSKRVLLIPRRDLVEWEVFSRRVTQSERPFDPASATLDSQGFVYLIQSVVGGPIKIGKADDPSVRLAEIQFWSPFELRVIAKAPGGYLLERELHHRFRPYRLHGEWFSEHAPGIKSCLRGRSKKAFAETSAFSGHILDTSPSEPTPDLAQPGGTK